MSVMDWEGCILAVCDGASVEGSEECDGGAGCTSCACDANWRSTTPVSLACECDASANYMSDGLGGCILAVCDGASVEGSEECDGGAGCTSWCL